MRGAPRLAPELSVRVGRTACSLGHHQSLIQTVWGQGHATMEEPEPIVSLTTPMAFQAQVPPYWSLAQPQTAWISAIRGG